MKYTALFVLLSACIFTSRTQAQVSPITLFFSANTIGVGTLSVIDILIDCQVESCAAADISIEFDPAALRVDGLSLGEFPNSPGNAVYILDSRVDTNTSTISLRYITQGNGNSGSTGVGVVLHIIAVALREGETELRFTHASIASADGQTVFIPQTLVGTITLVPPETTQTITVWVEVGDPDVVTVMASDGNSVIISETIVGESLQVEINSVSNTSPELVIDAPGYLACTLHMGGNSNVILHSGDVNNDGMIDIRDATTIGIANTRTQHDEVDLNHDGVINVYDLIHVGRNYGLNSGEC